MPEYINQNSYVVNLTGPDGIVRRVKPGVKVVLAEYFEKYVSRGYIKRVDKSGRSSTITPNIASTRNIKQLKITRTTQPRPQAVQQQIRMPHQQPQPQAVKQHQRIRHITSTRAQTRDRKIVGKRINADATEFYKKCLNNHYPISNNIGAGILSYNRQDCLIRLIESIKKNTNLDRTTIFISDDASTNNDVITYLDSLDPQQFVVLKNQTRLGIAGNSNRLLRCLKRFESSLLLNDDTEILAQDWEIFYRDWWKKTGIHSFCMRQPGVYGAKRGTQVNVANHSLEVVNDKPHGAIISLTNQVIEKVGYFDESFGIYGIEHVDWCERIARSGLQPPGYYDVPGSDKLFKIYPAQSQVESRVEKLQHARAIYNDLPKASRVYIGPTDNSSVPSVSYVIPFRDNGDRSPSIAGVVNNIRAQKFPDIQIIIAEQDSNTKIDVKTLTPITYNLVQASDTPFNKSKAFNRGVSLADHDCLILHDADIAIQADYTNRIWAVLLENEACHLGKHVVYLDQESTNILNSGFSNDFSCERLIGYFEGGSLACRKLAYWNIGGFNENFWGYGCEDTEFFYRLSNGSKWYENRHLDFIHLWHSRVGGWTNHHDTNKKIQVQLFALPLQQCIQDQVVRARNSGYIE